MKRISAVKLRRSLGVALNRTQAKGWRVIVQRRGKDIAALIPIEDLKLLRRLIEEEEDRIDLAAAEMALAEIAAGSEPRRFEDVCRELGLDRGTTKKRKRSS
jgi:prevent-host-death family protein